MQWNKLIMVIIIKTHTLNRPFSCVVTAGQLTGQLKLCSQYFNKLDINLCYSESYKTYMHSLVIASTAGLFIQDDKILTMSLI